MHCMKIHIILFNKLLVYEMRCFLRNKIIDFFLLVTLVYHILSYFNYKLLEIIVLLMIQDSSKNNYWWGQYLFCQPPKYGSLHQSWYLYLHKLKNMSFATINLGYLYSREILYGSVAYCK